MGTHDLCDEFIRRLGTMCLIVLVHFLAERGFRTIERRGDVLRCVVCERFKKRAGESLECAHGAPVGGGKRGERVE